MDEEDDLYCAQQNTSSSPYHTIQRSFPVFLSTLKSAAALFQMFTLFLPPPASLYQPAEVRMEVAPVASLTTTRLHKFSACNINQVVQTLVQLVTTGTKYPCIDMNDLCHNNTIYSIVTLLSITCFSSSTSFWSSAISSQQN